MPAEAEVASAYEEVLLSWYQAEVAGKAFFDSLAEGAENELERSKWTLLSHLEAAMAERIRVACADASITLTESADSSFIDLARQLTGQPWDSTMETLLPQLQAAIAEITEAVEAAPTAYTGIAGDFLAHEMALEAFVATELQGEDGSSAVKSMLNRWSTAS